MSERFVSVALHFKQRFNHGSRASERKMVTPQYGHSLFFNRHLYGASDQLRYLTSELNRAKFIRDY